MLSLKELSGSFIQTCTYRSLLIFVGSSYLWNQYRALEPQIAYHVRNRCGVRLKILMVASLLGADGHAIHGAPAKVATGGGDAGMETMQHNWRVGDTVTRLATFADFVSV